MLSTQMQTNAHILGKRKNCSNGVETPRRLGSLFIYRQELASLMDEKQKAPIRLSYCLITSKTVQRAFFAYYTSQIVL